MAQEILMRLEEERQLRALKARRHFRMLAKQVIHNLPWLKEVDDEEIGDNVTRNVSVLTRQKKIKYLTMKEKALLRKAVKYRTDEEKKVLNSCVGNYKCFKRYPEDVKYELAGVTFFEFFNAGRVLMRQGHEAHSLYFLLSGEVSVTIRVWDEVIQEMVTRNIGTIEEGNMFGEVSLLHNVPRTVTVTTMTPCELLCLKKENFDNILRHTLMKQWGDIKESMKNFSYFNQWNELSVRECCLVSEHKEYEPDETIYGDGAGTSIMVYFVIEGECSVIESLNVIEEVKHGRKTVSLFEDDNTSNISSTETHAMKIRRRNAKKQNIYSKQGAQLCNYDIVTFEAPEAKKLSTISVETQKPDISKTVIKQKTIFLQVCMLNAKSYFNEGLINNNRRVVAKTKVKCLLIPKYFLEQHNFADLWNRVDDYLYQQIPTTKQLFNNYLKQKRWLNYRKKLFNDTLSKRKFPNHTSIHDVPYSIRIQEEVE